MADVGPRRRVGPTGEAGGTRDRGQLILVTALTMAILFVALALILNTAIYTENLATRSSDIGGGTDAVRYHDAARDGVGGVIDFVNAHNNTDNESLNSNLTAGVDAFSNASARLFAGSDRAVETSLDSTVNGTRIAQTETNRNFTNASGVASWVVVEEVSNARAGVINVTNDNFLAAPGSASAFELVLEDADGDTWRLNVTDDSGTTEVGIDNGTGSTTCAASTTTPVIDLAAGTVDDVACNGLNFAEGIDTPYDISINNGDAINGTYSLTVDNATLAKDADAGTATHLFADGGGGQPFATHAVYSANVTVVYQTPRLFYNTTVRVAPEEPDG